MKLKKWLVSKHACAEAVAWVGEKMLTEAWQTCERADWMMWLVSRTEIENGSDTHKNVIRCACAFARLALPEWDRYAPDDKRPLLAIEAAERYALEWTQESKAAAAYAADAADAADAAVAAARAAYAAAAAADAADAAYAAQKRMSDIVRQYFPTFKIEGVE